MMVMNLYSAFSVYIFTCALQGIDIWVRSDIIMYNEHQWDNVTMCSVVSFISKLHHNLVFLGTCMVKFVNIVSSTC